MTVQELETEPYVEDIEAEKITFVSRLVEFMDMVSFYLGREIPDHVKNFSMDVKIGVAYGSDKLPEGVAIMLIDRHYIISIPIARVGAMVLEETANGIYGEFSTMKDDGMVDAIRKLSESLLQCADSVVAEYDAAVTPKH